MAERNIVQVIGNIVEMAPDLEPHFRDLLAAIPYTAPEILWMRWGELGDIMNKHAREHPKAAELVKLVNRLPA